jgi:hypothetical protein
MVLNNLFYITAKVSGSYVQGFLVQAVMVAAQVCKPVTVEFKIHFVQGRG